MSQINIVDAKKEKWQENLIINRKVLNVRLDMGTDYNVIALSDLRKLWMNTKVSKSHSKRVAYAGHKIQAKGKIHAEMSAQR